jgi:hypothetical protein
MPAAPVPTYGSLGRAALENHHPNVTAGKLSAA